MRQYMQAKPRLDETQAILDTSNYPNSQIDLSFIDPKLVINYLENMSPQRMGSLDFFNSAGILRASPSKVFLPPALGAVPSYKTTITPFGPILPTSVTVAPPDLNLFVPRPESSSLLQPVVPFGTLPKLGSSSGLGLGGPVMYQPFVVTQRIGSSNTVIPQPQVIIKTSETKPSTAEVIRKILNNESSSESEPEEAHKVQSRNSSQRNSGNQEFKDQATAVHSPVVASAVPQVASDSPLVANPNRLASMRTPRAERMNKKREELEKVQQFLEESRAVHEKIYSNFDVRRVSTRGVGAPSPDSKRRSFSDVTHATNLAELRRNISDKYAVKDTSPASSKREPSPMPPLPVASPTEPARGPNPRAIKPINTADSRDSSSDRKNPGNAGMRTPSASAQSPKPASPDRLVSGVFVSYPRGRRSLSAPRSDNESKRKSPGEESGSVISSLRPGGSAKKLGGKMTAEEYAQFRQNLLNRSEQHAVTSGAGSSVA